MIDTRLLWRRIDLLEKQIAPLEQQLIDLDRKRKDGVLRGPGSRKGGRPTKEREALRKTLLILVHDQTAAYRQIRELSELNRSAAA